MESIQGHLRGWFTNSLSSNAPNTLPRLRQRIQKFQLIQFFKIFFIRFMCEFTFEFFHTIISLFRQRNQISAERKSIHNSLFFTLFCLFEFSNLFRLKIFSKMFMFIFQTKRVFIIFKEINLCQEFLFSWVNTIFAKIKLYDTFVSVSDSIIVLYFQRFKMFHQTSL